MKIPHALAATLIAGLAFAAPAQATTVGLLATPDTGSYSLYEYAGTSLSDTFSGSLASHSVLTVTYSYTELSPYAMALSATGANNQGNSSANAFAFDNPFTPLSSSQTSSAASLPIIVTANLAANSGTAIIDNESNGNISFNSIFTAFAFGNGGFLNVSYAVSSVPLPPAALLFLTGLLAMAGFAVYKKNKTSF